jgi:ElaB/YqjD/DUF883 family membrane-anchored ribosome-binding protein
MSEIFDGGPLTEQLRTLVNDAEALLRAATGETEEARQHAEAGLKELRRRLTALEDQVKSRARDVDTYVRDNPWQAVAVAGGVALLLGLVMGRK